MSKCINSPKSVCTISMHYANKDYSITSLVTKKNLLTTHLTSLFEPHLPECQVLSLPRYLAFHHSSNNQQ